VGLEMERECTETRTDLEIMSSWASDEVKRGDLFDQLLVFACANAFQNLAECESRLDNVKRWSTLRTNLTDFLANYPGSVRDARTRVLRHMPDPTNWPNGFVEHVMAKINKTVTKAETRGLKNMTAEQIQICVAGKRIEDIAKAAQSMINNRFNPFYSDDLPSGHQNDIAMLRLVRRYQWHHKNLELAENAVRRDLASKKKDGTFRLVIGGGFTKQDAIERAYLRRMETMDYDWYPDCWFTYVAMGRPAGEDAMSALFNSGVTSKILADGLGPQEAAASIGTNAQRKRFHSKLGRAEPTSSSSSSSANPSLLSAGTTAELTEQINIDRMAISLLEKEIPLATKFGDTERATQLERELYLTIGSCREKVQTLQRDAVRSANEFSTPSPLLVGTSRMASSTPLSGTTAQV
jgi:hypothetical protein